MLFTLQATLRTQPERQAPWASASVAANPITTIARATNIFRITQTPSKNNETKRYD